MMADTNTSEVVGPLLALFPNLLTTDSLAMGVEGLTPTPNRFSGSGPPTKEH